MESDDKVLCKFRYYGGWGDRTKIFVDVDNRFKLGDRRYLPGSWATLLRETAVLHSCNRASKDACVRLHHTTPASPAAFMGLSLFKADKMAGSDMVSSDKSSLCDGRNSSLWKDSKQSLGQTEEQSLDLQVGKQRV